MGDRRVPQAVLGAASRRHHVLDQTARGTQVEQLDPGTTTLPPPPATIHMVGIGGIGVSGLARILLDRGYRVTGSDLSDSPVVDDLRTLGIHVFIGHHPSNIGDASLVVVTAAANDSNPEIAAARSRGVPVVKRARLLGDLTASKTCLAIAGSHGKSTTAGMLAYTLTKAGTRPSFAVGAVVPQLGANAGPGEGQHFVVEADEYDYSFLTLRPDIAIITNIEHDHPDLFPDLESIDAAFRRFAALVKPGGMLVLSADDPGCQRLTRWLSDQPDGPEIVSVGRSASAEWRLDDAPVPPVLTGPGGCGFSLGISVPGPHNRMNAAMTFAACYLLGVDLPAVLSGLRSFSGVGRRFDLRGEVDGTLVYDDYAHHPTELTATIAAARERYPSRRIWAVFQPHTFSRTKQLLREFADSLDQADRAVLIDVYPARETDNLGVSSRSIGELMRTSAPVYETPEQAARAVAGEAEPGDVVLVLGAGDIWKASNVLLEQLDRRHGTRNATLQTDNSGLAGVRRSKQTRTGTDG
jgi:UDP-N-acetylmuramate--alanine ligase